MALFLSPTSLFSNTRTTVGTAPPSLLTTQNFTTPVRLHRLIPLFSSNLSAWLGRCGAVSPGRPPPPDSGPPTGKDPKPSAGPAATFSRLQDTVQIFFAVLFWISLFFWASAWDGRNDGRPSKGSGFKR